MDEIINKMKKIFDQNDIPIFGMANSELLENRPPGYRPSDLLSSARSMICMGIPVSKGVFQCGERSNRTYWRTANIYYRFIDAVLLQVSRVIEEEGDVAVPVFG
ncbi:MAG: hypothetical protein V1930_05940 [Pseudomonadota bacterium]